MSACILGECRELPVDRASVTHEVDYVPCVSPLSPFDQPHLDRGLDSCNEDLLYVCERWEVVWDLWHERMVGLRHEGGLPWLAIFVSIDATRACPLGIEVQAKPLLTTTRAALQVIAFESVIECRKKTFVFGLKRRMRKLRARGVPVI